jgi:hypothetical protein
MSLNEKCKWCEDKISPGEVFCDEDCRQLFIRRQTKITPAETLPPLDIHDKKWRHTLDIVDMGKRTEDRDRKREED